jgi:hypothetical protein
MFFEYEIHQIKIYHFHIAYFSNVELRFVKNLEAAYVLQFYNYKIRVVLFVTVRHRSISVTRTDFRSQLKMQLPLYLTSEG